VCRKTHTVPSVDTFGPPIDAPFQVVDPNRDSPAVNFVGKASVPGVGPGLDDATTVTPSVFDSISTVESTSNCAGAARSGGGQRAPSEALPEIHTQASSPPFDGSITVSLSSVQTCGKPGLQPQPEAQLPIHTQPPTPTLGVPGASAITRIGTGPSDALGNTDTRANESNKSDIESTSVSFKSPPTDNYDEMLEGCPEDPHTSNQPICTASVKDELSSEALRHAFNVGTIKGIVPYGMKAYDPKLHGEDRDLCRSAYALGYWHQDYSEPTTPKHFMDALQVGYIFERHNAMGGPVMYLKAMCAGFHPGLDGSPKVFLKQHAKGKLPPGSGRSSPVTPQEFHEQMVVEVCPLPVNAGAKRDSSGTVTHHFVAPSGPELMLQLWV